MLEKGGIKATQRIRTELPPQAQPVIIARTANAFSENKEVSEKWKLSGNVCCSGRESGASPVPVRGMRGCRGNTSKAGSVLLL